MAERPKQELEEEIPSATRIKREEGHHDTVLEALGLCLRLPLFCRCQRETRRKTTILGSPKNKHTTCFEGKPQIQSMLVVVNTTPSAKARAESTKKQGMQRPGATSSCTSSQSLQVWHFLKPCCKPIGSICDRCTLQYALP